MGYWIESLITFTYLLWGLACWSIGHIFHRILTKCGEPSFFSCSGNDVVGFSTLFLGSLVYFRIARHVVLFFVKGELPDGDSVMKNFSKMLQSENRQERRLKVKK